MLYYVHSNRVREQNCFPFCTWTSIVFLWQDCAGCNKTLALRTFYFQCTLWFATSILPSLVLYDFNVALSRNCFQWYAIASDHRSLEWKSKLYGCTFRNLNDNVLCIIFKMCPPTRIYTQATRNQKSKRRKKESNAQKMGLLVPSFLDEKVNVCADNVERIHYV